MKHMKKYILVLVVLIYSISGYSQDPEFTQFYANPIYLNPAFAGSAYGPRVALNYRNQWPSITGGFVTYAASYDQHLDILSGGLGAQVIYDRAGNGGLSTTVGSMVYSYMLRVNSKFAIKAGIEASLISKSIDYGKLIWGDQITRNGGVSLPTNEPPLDHGVYSTNTVTDFSAGIIGFTKKIYAGVAVNHISEPMISFYQDSKSILPMKITAHAGLMLPLDNNRNPRNFFSPNIMYQTQQKFSQFNIGAYYMRDYFVAGAWFRQTSENLDAIMILLGVKKESVKIGYSYDITYSDARLGAIGSHEISVIIELKTSKREQSTKWRQLPCPTF
jgi:type IX secretion system PorP/SprF family membrane protein